MATLTADPAWADPAAYVREGGDGTATLHLAVEGAHCAACIARIEGALKAVPGVVDARLNLSTRRLRVAWRAGTASPADLVAAVTRLGYAAVPFDPAALAAASDEEGRRLLRCLAVAGFAAGNVMLLSISVWAGAFGDMGPATRDFLHWLSALIALPAVAYAGRPFFAAALAGLRVKSPTMDLPISLAVILAACVSLQATIAGGEHAFFDAAVTLLFFLLIGRTLDRRARAGARRAAEQLLLLSARAATVVGADGARRSVPIADIRPGMRVAVAPGDRIPVDGRVIEGRSEIDTSLVTGETLPRAVAPGEPVHAGTANLAGALVVEAAAAADDTLLAEIVRLMEAAERGRPRAVRLADRVAGVYVPAVLALALAAFLFWWLAGVAWQQALWTAVAVLVITCPCALALAVPVVQVVAAARLFARGILIKGADALERLAAVDTVVFDKTGTLTLGRLALREAGRLDAESLAVAARLAAGSRHPLCRALAAAAPAVRPAAELREEPGLGLAATVDGEAVRLGSRAWCGVEDAAPAEGPELWLARPNRLPVRFGFVDAPRPDAAEVVAALRARGLAVELASGDRPETVAEAAAAAGIARWSAALRPADKASRLAALAAQGRRVLMVGDGLNDAPALAAAHVSMSPSIAADVSRTAADMLFQGERLAPVAEAHAVARRAGALMRQNLGLALAYNLLAVPLAFAGLVTPLVAAVAMSSSSLLVTLNALRLGRAGAGK